MATHPPVESFIDSPRTAYHVNLSRSRVSGIACYLLSSKTLLWIPSLSLGDVYEAKIPIANTVSWVPF